jgi:uncharacterized membrane protein
MQRRWFVGVTVVLLVLIAGAAVPVSSAAGDDTSPQTQDPQQLSTPEGFNSTEFRVTAYENGTARWTIIHSTVLEANTSERAEFETFASEFNSAETETYRKFKTRARALTAFGSEETTREMNATAFSKEATVDEQFRVYGRLRMSFTWTNFARTTDRGIIIDDVFAGGMYVGPDQRLVFARGPNLRFVSETEPGPDRLGTVGNLTASETIEYQGEREFADRRPKVVMVRPDAIGAAQSGPTTPADTLSSEFGPGSLVLGLLVLLVVGAIVAWYSGILETLRQQDEGDAETTTEAAAASTVDNAPEPAVPEEELLSDEDRVLQLLDDNGGRMKQVNIVENTEWSKSKVSMLLSEMEDEELISKLRVGRENIISKAGEEPDAVGSPFDDE